MLPRMSLEEQIGQVIVGVASAGLDDLAGPVALGHVGGVLVPPGTASGTLELAAALNRLQGLASYPLLCIADLSGPAPLVPGATWLPGELALGAARQPELSRRCGARLAEEARAMGVQVLLGPVLDVWHSPVAADGHGRSFGESSTLVATLGAAFVEGCQSHRVLATGCYFPGRGHLLYDAELNLAVLAQDRQALDKIDLVPYVEACRAGLGAIMTGHLHVAALDTLPTRLATHSSSVVEGLLRRTLGYQGLLLSANLDVPEVRSRYGPAEAAILAFAAGHDVLLTEEPVAVYRALYEVLVHGDVPTERLQEAVGRVWAAKEWLGLTRDRFVPTRPHDPEPGRRLVQEVARASLAAVRGQAALISGRRLLVLAIHANGDGTLPDVANLESLASKHVGGACVQTLDLQQGAGQVDELLAETSPAEAAIVFVGDKAPAPGRRDGSANGSLGVAIRALKRAGLPVGVVLTGNPYALASFPEADLLLYAPSDAPPWLEATFAYLSGQADAPGRVPVSVPGLRV